MFQKYYETFLMNAICISCSLLEINNSPFTNIIDFKIYSKINANTDKNINLLMKILLIKHLKIISVMVHSNQRGGEVIVGHKSHILLWEQGGASQVILTYIINTN